MIASTQIHQYWDVLHLTLSLFKPRVDSHTPCQVSITQTDLDRSRTYQLQSVSAGSLDTSRDSCDSNVGPVGIALLSKADRRSGMASRVHHDLPWKVTYTMTAHDYTS